MEEKHTALTFEQAKDLIAVKYGCNNWIELKVNIALQKEFREEYKINESIALDQAAELHTMSLNSQLSSALESYNRECKRNGELHYALSSLVEGLQMETKYHPEIKRSIVVNVRITNAQKALSKHQPIKNDEIIK
jgi:hypothetical protein